MKISRPSPALIVSMVALVVALGGTATAASVLIKNSSQIKAGAVSGSDIANNAISSAKIKNGSILTGDLSSGLQKQLKKSGPAPAGGSFTATEAIRKVGPTKIGAGQHDIATLVQLPPGTYALFAKTIVTAEVGNLGLGELLRQNKTVSAQCSLTAGGDQDNASQQVAGPYSQAPATMNMQLTRTIDTPTDIKVTCTVNDYPWNASDTSIVALKLSGSSRTDVQG